MNYLKRLSSITIILLLAFAADTIAKEKPLKIYILVGQSNMEGQADLRVLDYLKDDPDTVGYMKPSFNLIGICGL